MWAIDFYSYISVQAEKQCDLVDYPIHLLIHASLRHSVSELEDVLALKEKEYDNLMYSFKFDMIFYST